jgi:hypothetical protein
MLAPLLRAQVSDPTVVILSEGFEDVFPEANGWSVGGGSGPTWRDVNAPFGGEGTHSGNWKGYCAGTAYPFNSPEAQPTYANNMAAAMTRTIDLRDCRAATLSFWYKMPSIEAGWDFGRVYLSPLGRTPLWTCPGPATA